MPLGGCPGQDVVRHGGGDAVGACLRNCGMPHGLAPPGAQGGQKQHTRQHPAPGQGKHARRRCGSRHPIGPARPGILSQKDARHKSQRKPDQRRHLPQAAGQPRPHASRVSPIRASSAPG